MTEEEFKILEKFIELKIYQANERNIKPTSDYIFEHLLDVKNKLRKILIKE